MKKEEREGDLLFCPASRRRDRKELVPAVWLIWTINGYDIAIDSLNLEECSYE